MPRVVQSPTPSGARVALSKAPLALKSGGVVSSNSYPCPRTLRAEEETRGLPLICLSAFRLATWREASGRRDGLVSRELCSLHHQPRGRGRERAQDGAAAGGDGRVAQKPSRGSRHSFSPPTSKWSCQPLPPGVGGACRGRSSVGGACCRCSSDPSPG